MTFVEGFGSVAARSGASPGSVAARSGASSTSRIVPCALRRFAAMLW